MIGLGKQFIQVLPLYLSVSIKVNIGKVNKLDSKNSLTLLMCADNCIASTKLNKTFGSYLEHLPNPQLITPPCF